MNPAKSKKHVRGFKREYALHRISEAVLEDVFERQGFTIIPFNPVVNDPDVETVICSLGLQDMVAQTNGFLYVDENYRLVFVNEKLSEEEKLLVLAHEQGHYYCGHMNFVTRLGRSVEEEFEANEFAHYLLRRTASDRVREWIRRHRVRIVVMLVLMFLIAGGIWLYRDYRERRLYEGEYYVTMHGEKYHVRNCVVIEGHPVRRLEKKDVESGKYEPCSLCLPNR